MQQFTGYKPAPNVDATDKQRGLLVPALFTKLKNLLNITSVTAPITNTGGALGISAATTAAAGSLSAADKTKLDALGAALSSVRSTNLAVAASTVTALHTLALTQGTWFAVGFSNILMGAAAGTVDVYLTGGGAGIASQNLAASTQAQLITGPVVYVVGAGGTTITLNGFGGAAFTSRGGGGAGGFVNMTGIQAIRVG